jgi:miniconductance mechanosensitive channel
MLINLISQIAGNYGLSEAGARLFAFGCLTLCLVLVCFIANIITRRLLLRAIGFIIKKSRNNFDNALLDNGFFRRLAHIIPALIIYFSSPIFNSAAPWLQKLSIAYISLAGIFIIDSFLNACLVTYSRLELSQKRPIRIYIQVAKIIIFSLIIIFILATLMERSPWKFLGGIGALSAVILLVFKDSLLGFVAGFQLTSANMVRIGDWIEMSKYGADGDVVDITLNSVKVRNWDKTYTTIPTYALISDSFKNWRGMQDSGGRRIKRAIYIDMTSIRFCTDRMIRRFESMELLKNYIQNKKSELKVYNQKNNIQSREIVNGRRMTNIGTFRAYIIAYLRHHPMVRQDMTFLVRQLAPADNGLPLEIYVFCADQVWANYEAIQADIFDHILAVIPEFDLRVFQAPTGYDFQLITR